MNPDDSAQITDGLRKRIEWLKDPASYERTRLEFTDILSALEGFLQLDNMPEEFYDTIHAMTLALTNWHPYFRLKWSRTEPKRREKLERDIFNTTTRDLAIYIDVEVAKGIKLESAVHDACVKFSVSRRSAFRALKLERMIRLNSLELDYSYPTPDGFEVTPDGLLKRRDD